MNLWANILDILFPNNCISCNKKGKRICGYCVSTMQKSSSHEHKNMYSIFDYKDSLVKKLLLEFKYKNRQHVIDSLSPYIADEIIEILSEKYALLQSEKIIISSIPMSAKRLRTRNKNHGEIIAKVVTEEIRKRGLTVHYQKILEKKFETTPQAKIKNRQARLENIKNSFDVAPNFKEKYKNNTALILIIDDITTTGATLLEAESVMKKNGFKNILLFSIAH